MLIKRYSRGQAGTKRGWGQWPGGGGGGRTSRQRASSENAGHTRGNGNKLRQHPRAIAPLLFNRGTTPFALCSSSKLSLSLSLSLSGSSNSLLDMAPCVTADDIREIERQVKYLWSNQMPEFLTKPAKSWLSPGSFVHGDRSPRWSSASFVVYCRFARVGLLCRIERYWAIGTRGPIFWTVSPDKSEFSVQGDFRGFFFFYFFEFWSCKFRGSLRIRSRGGYTSFAAFLRFAVSRYVVGYLFLYFLTFTFDYGIIIFPFSFGKFYFFVTFDRKAIKLREILVRRSFEVFSSHFENGNILRDERRWWFLNQDFTSDARFILILRVSVVYFLYVPLFKISLLVSERTLIHVEFEKMWELTAEIWATNVNMSWWAKFELSGTQLRLTTYLYFVDCRRSRFPPLPRRVKWLSETIAGLVIKALLRSRSSTN